MCDMAITPDHNFIRNVSKLKRLHGAAEKTRTSTPVKEQRPQRCASTNSATAAQSSLPLNTYYIVQLKEGIAQFCEISIP